MSKTWKCNECVKHGTDACFNGGKYDYDDCKYKLVDADYAYQQGRRDAIDSIIRKIDDEYYDGGYGDYHEVAMIVRMLEELKEQKND